MTKTGNPKWLGDVKFILRGLAVCLLVALVAPCFFPPIHHPKKPRVTLYASQDQVYAEPILKEFADWTRIKASTLFDSEAVKTVGLANRLLAERTHPQCDVFWNNEELRTRRLAARNVFAETNAWAAFGYRSRRIVINKNRLTLVTAPRSLIELTNEIWRGKVALAYPLFGTTATHFLALRQYWGDTQWQAWCRALAANNPFLVDGNSLVVNLVGRGEAWIGLTDSDDISVGQRAGSPVVALPLTEESLLIPNTVALVRRRLESERLFDYLQSPAVVERLVAANALEGLIVSEVATPTLKVDWDALLRDLDSATATMKQIFLR